MRYRKQSISFLLTGLAGLSLPSCQKAPKSHSENDTAKPNIILIVADDLGMNDLGCLGNKHIKTPNLDYLASEGIRMVNGYCTSASSSPSRSVLLTGLYNHANGQYGLSHSSHHFRSFENLTTLPEILKTKGFVTGRVGKFHVQPEEVYPFDSIIPGDAWNSYELSVNASRFISSAKDPFFLYYCTNTPHRGNQVAEDLPGKPNRFGNRPEGYKGLISNRFHPDSLDVPSYLPDTRECRAELAQYYESVSNMDQGIGELFNQLKKSGKWENTVIIFLSDNGIAFPGAKTTLYEPGMHLPLIIRDPELSVKGTTCDAMVSWVDITPTILDYAGYRNEEKLVKPRKGWGDPNVPADFQGKSFRAVLTQEHPVGWDTIFASHTFHEVTMYYPMRVIQTRKYKLIHNLAWQLPYPFASDLWESATWQGFLSSGVKVYGKREIASFIQRPEFELYNLADDSLETHNRINNPAYTEIVRSLKDRLYQFSKETNDPWLIKYEHQ